MKTALRLLVAAQIVSYLLPVGALAQTPPAAPPLSDAEQRANYCLDTARARDTLNAYALNLQAQVKSLSDQLSDAQKKLKGTEDEFDAYKKKFPAIELKPETKAAEPEKAK